VTPRELDELKSRLARITDLRRVQRVLAWDMQVMMPPAGASVRGEQQATIDSLAHELFVSDETDRLLTQLEPYAQSLDPESDDACLIRVVREDFEKQVRVPSELRAEAVKAATAGFQVWREAKPKSDFESFRPYLERHLELRHRYIECVPPADEAYDILLDDYERGMKTAEVRSVFERVKEELVPLIAEAAEAYGGDDGILERSFPVDAQEALSHELVDMFGHREQAWRIDPTAHPFASGGGVNDIRITT
jgi:carboxypeptidase Taq